MRALEKKLWRDLVALAGPGFAAALVVACGIAASVSLRGVTTSLSAARHGYFERSRFADVVARATRAPRSVLTAVAAVDGVDAVDGRTTSQAVLELEGEKNPVRALVTSMRSDADALNQVFVRHGRAPEHGAVHEVVVSEGFALARGLRPGAVLTATIDGRRLSLVVVGVGTSPEYLYVLPPGTIFPDDESYAIVWFAHDVAVRLFGAEGTFNDLAVRLAHGADERDVIAAVDRLLAPHGGASAVGRDDQPSWRFVSEELNGIERQTQSIPLVFLAVAALLLHLVLSRLVDTQREIIALLKAVGYGALDIVVHYAAIALVIVSLGAALGIALGGVVGAQLMHLYQSYFRFDALVFRMEASDVVVAVLLSVLAALAGAVGATRRALALEPAAAMQPPSPPAYRPGLAERVGLIAALPSAARMIVRQIERRFARTLTTVVGVSFAVAIIVLASVLDDSLTFSMENYFLRASREDAELTLTRPIARLALTDALARVPGVVLVEATRAVPVRIETARGRWDGAVFAREPGGSLRLALDERGRRLPALPPDGVVMTDTLARDLGLGLDDEVTLTRIDGDRRAMTTRIAGFTEDMMGLHVAADVAVLARLAGDGDLATGAFLRFDPRLERAAVEELRAMPVVAGLGFRAATYAALERLLVDSIGIMRVVLALLASIIAIGIVYNTSRIALAERARELSTLRVLGFTRGEVSSIFLGEQLVVVLAALPLGWVLGRLAATAIMNSVDMSDLFRMPIVSRPSTYVFATVVVICAAFATALLARRRLDRLDLVAVLKARE